MSAALIDFGVFCIFWLWIPSTKLHLLSGTSISRIDMLYACRMLNWQNPFLIELEELSRNNQSFTEGSELICVNTIICMRKRKS